MYKKFLITFLIITTYSLSALAEKVIVFKFTEDEKKTLKVRKVKKKTTYTIGSNEIEATPLLTIPVPKTSLFCETQISAPS